MRFGEPLELIVDGETFTRLVPTRSVRLGLILLPMINPCTWTWGWSYTLPELPPVDAP